MQKQSQNLINKSLFLIQEAFEQFQLGIKDEVQNMRKKHQKMDERMFEF